MKDIETLIRLHCHEQSHRACGSRNKDVCNSQVAHVCWVKTSDVDTYLNGAYLNGAFLQCDYIGS